MKNLKVILIGFLVSAGSIATYAQSMNDEIHIDVSDSLKMKIYMIDYADVREYEGFDQIHNSFSSLIEKIEGFHASNSDININYMYNSKLEVQRIDNQSLGFDIQDGGIFFERNNCTLNLIGDKYRIEIVAVHLGQLLDSTIQKLLVDCMADLPSKNLHPTILKYRVVDGELLRNEDFMTKIGYVDIAWMYHGEASVINGSISTGVGGGLGLMRKYKGDLTSWYYVGSSAIGVWDEKTEQIDELALVSLGYRFQTNGVTRGNWMGLEISKPIAPFHVLNGQEISYRYSGYYLISNGIWCSTSLYKVANENVTIPVFGLSVQF